MIDLLNLNKLKRQRLSSLLGIALDGSRLDGLVVRRTNGSLEVQQSFSVSLSLDPLTADAELVGREIRNHLDAAGIRERLFFQAEDGIRADLVTGVQTCALPI